jgi:hypothetical protein
MTDRLSPYLSGPRYSYPVSIAPSRAAHILGWEIATRLLESKGPTHLNSFLISDLAKTVKRFSDWIDLIVDLDLIIQESFLEVFARIPFKESGIDYGDCTNLHVAADHHLTQQAMQWVIDNEFFITAIEAGQRLA